MAEARVSSRPIQSCFQCRKRKIKCSKSYPCTPCILRGEGETCREVDKSMLQSTDKIEELVDRVQKLENTISVLSRRGSPSDDESPRSSRRRELSSSPYTKNACLVPNRPRSRGIHHQTPSLHRVNSPAEEGVMILEDFAMGHKVNQTRATNDFRTSPFDSPTSTSENLPQTNLPNSHPWSIFAPSSQDAVRRILCVLPSQGQIQLLLQFYVQHVDWYAKVIHVPTFMAETSTLLSHIHQHRYHMVNVNFLGLLLIVLCLSFHFADTAVCEQLLLDYTACSDYAQHLCSSAQACLQYTNFLSSHSLENLQTLVLLGIYQKNNNEADSHWATIGAAIKIAQNLGMSRLWNETGTRQYPPEWRSSIRREIARRVWWNLVVEDWSHAMAHQGTYSVHPSQNHTSFPANIDDCDLIEADVVQSKPLNIHTEMSSFICRIRLFELHRQMVDEINCGGYELDFAQELDSKITTVIGEIKDYFQVTTDPQKYSRPNHVTSMERTLCHMMAQTRLLRLHRPFLFRGCFDTRYTNSRNQCIKSARLILQHLGTNCQAGKLLRWWFAVWYAFGAVVVLFADLCYLHSNGSESEVEQRRKEIKDALQLFKSVGESAPSMTRNTIRLIENLLAAESTMLAKESQNRVTSKDASSFEQIVKKIIVNSSPGGNPFPMMVGSNNYMASLDVATPSNMTAALTYERLSWPQSAVDLHSFNIGGQFQDVSPFPCMSTTLLPPCSS
ncbi:hypothetical protein AN958_11727 [Leucoagaricus sp. SymC.cos]|nr:hypothetical protein AN958_11727 [Leucoagaricus sp. SymC.cos]